MKSRIKSPRCARIARAAIVSLGLTMATLALANPLPPEAPSVTNGDYTVTLSGCDQAGTTVLCAVQWVEERVEPNGAWQAVSGTFVDKPPGIYSYRTAETYCDGWFGGCSTYYSAAVSVRVIAGSMPPPEPLDAQLSYEYAVRFGNVVGDAGTDLLVERTSGPAEGNGVIDAIVLQRVSGGFAAVVPSAAQRGSSRWQPSNVSVAVEDMNADGYADVALKNVAAAVPGAEDQIVFASANAYDSRPKGVRAFDDSLREFTANLIDYMANPRYFVDNAPLTVYTWRYHYTYCPSMSTIDSPGLISMLECADIVFINYSVVPDYSSFEDDAVGIWQDEAAVAAGDMSSSEAASRIVDRIEDVFDVAIGGWNMREIFGDGDGIDDSAERRGLEGFLAILGIGNARADEVEPDEAQTQGPRENDVIHIVGRYIFGSSVNKMHTALLYRMPGTGIPTWFGGYDSDPSALGDGTLIAKTNAPSDSPLIMRMTLGEVAPPAPLSRFVYFFTDMQSAHEHYKRLPNANKARYDAVPEFPCGGCNGRNSNGYAHGLILATNGQALARPGFIFNGLTGWEYPVEAYYFGR